jgi:hypothetical protein
LSVPGYVYGDENKYIVLYWTYIGSILFYAIRARKNKQTKNKTKKQLDENLKKNKQKQ